ncbi:MAG: folate-binding protein YgfZ [Gammaproteobacteria bacterium]
MNQNWQEFITTQGAVIDKQVLESFTSADSRSFNSQHTYLCDLSNLGIIRASGDDALSFLHGQFTNDLNLVTNNNSQLSSYCNPKGRMLAIFRVFQKDDDYYLILNRDVLEPVLKKLTMFKLMAKVDLSDVSDEYVLLGLAGPASASTLKEHGLQIPESTNTSTHEKETTVICMPSESSRFLLISEAEHAKTIWQSISNHTTASTYKTWELHDIQNGIPQVTAETNEAFIPQMVNLELIGGVNFQKGCYPGQEIVARTHYLGKPNRRMYHVSISTKNCPLPGTNIFSAKDGEQPVGKIVSAQHSSDDICNALAVLRTAKKSDDELHLEPSAGPKVTLLTLPYSLKSTEAP